MAINRASKIYTTKDCVVAACVIAPLAYGLIWKLSESPFLANVFLIHFVAFVASILFAFKVVTRKSSPDWDRASKETPTFLIIAHLLLAKIIFLTGFIIAGW